MSEIFDRGMKKWASSFMLPEHTKMLAEIDFDFHKQRKPTLDEHQLQEIDEKLKFANEYQVPLLFEIWRGGFFEELEGVVKKIDQHNQILWVDEPSGDLHKLKFDEITGVEIVDD